MAKRKLNKLTKKVSKKTTKKKPSLNPSSKKTEEAPALRVVLKAMCNLSKGWIAQKYVYYVENNGVDDYIYPVSNTSEKREGDILTLNWDLPNTKNYLYVGRRFEEEPWRLELEVDEESSIFILGDIDTNKKPMNLAQHPLLKGVWE